MTINDDDLGVFSVSFDINGLADFFVTGAKARAS
jgi:hypothetical protein